MISGEVYRELVEAVGEENVSREPAVLDGYAFQPTFNDELGLWVPRPEAVVLPGCTEEVQEVVRICNRHGLRFKAFSTGWGAWAGPSGGGVVQVDLRRMDRVLDIDEKNMIAVVQPYACGGQVRAEAMKRGLNVHMISAGAGVSPLASACAAFGPGTDGTYSPRNLLGVEWVLPDGEVLRLGTLGSGCGWFCGDGPGPSLRGIMRGKAGALSGNGIFTACALKLFPWPGPPQPRPRGLFFDLEMEMPPGLRLYYLVFPDYRSFGEAFYDLAQEGVDYNMQKAAVGVVPLILFPHLGRLLEGRSGIRDALQALRHGIILVIAAESVEEMKFKEGVARAVTGRYGGIALDLGSTPLGPSFTWSIVSGAVPGLAFRPGGQMQSGLGPNDSWDSAVTWDRLSEGIKRKWIERNGCVDDMGDACVDMAWEGGAIGHSEELWYYDPRDEGHQEAARGLVLDFFLQALRECCDQPWNIFPQQRKVVGPLQGDFNRWQQDILRRLDPRGAADAYLYVGEEEMDLSGIKEGEAAELKRLLEERDWLGREGWR
ncbi:FAD-binding oxidoreductase [Candidatus Solincola sp.]